MAYRLVPTTQTQSALTPKPVIEQRHKKRYRIDKPASRGVEPDLSLAEATRAAGRNIIPSAIQYGKDFVQPFLHPIETAENVYKLGKGAAQHAIGHEGPETEEMKIASAMKQFYADRYGSWEGFKRAYATDPVGVLGDASMFMTGGAGLAARAPGLVGKVGRTAGQIGRALDPVSMVTRPASAVARRVTSQMSGVTPNVMRIASEAGYRGGPQAKTFQRHLRGRAPVTEPLEMAREGLADMAREKMADYKTNIADARASRRRISMDPIIRKFNKLNDSFQVKTSTGTYSTIDKQAQFSLREIKKLLVEWYNDPELHNANGLDALKRRVQDLTPKDMTKEERRIFRTVNAAIKDEIIAKVPSYKKAMSEYAEASEHETDIERALSLGDQASTDTAVRKLTSGMRNNVNTNFGFRTGMIDELAERVPGLREALAGQTLNSATARGLAAGTGPFSRALSAVTPFSSPRLMGEAAYYAGKFSPGRRGLNPPLFQAGRASALQGEEQRALRERRRRRNIANIIDQRGPQIELPVVPGWPIQE